MKCPNCETELDEGKFYCSKCGKEIQFVPDYELELEDQIHSFSIIHDDEKEGFDIHLKHTINKQKAKRVFVVIFILLATVLLAFMMINSYIHSSFDYVYKKALDYGESGSLDEAISYLDQAIEMRTENYDLKMLKVDYLLKNNDQSTAKELLEQMITEGFTTFSVYDNLIQLEIEEQNLDSIESLVRSSNNNDIYNAYKNFLTEIPSFSCSEGTYYNKITLQLNTSINGTIFYTLDGSIPNTDSLIYQDPITLDEGTYIISAIFVSEMGTKSDVAKGTFHIDLSKPYAPSVNIYSGLTTNAKSIVIEVQKGCKVLYTLDGTEVTLDSKEYVGPIAMPLGKFTLRCVTINNSGEMSRETRRDVELLLPADFEVDQALAQMYKYQFSLGLIDDLNGYDNDKSERYTYSIDAAFGFQGQPYYLVEEWYEKSGEVRKKSGDLYGVNMYTYAVYHVSNDDNDAFFVYE